MHKYVSYFHRMQKVLNKKQEYANKIEIESRKKNVGLKVNKRRKVKKCMCI